VAWEPNKPLVMEEIEVAPPKANEVRIKVRDVHLPSTQHRPYSFIHSALAAFHQHYSILGKTSCKLIQVNRLDAVLLEIN